MVNQYTLRDLLVLECELGIALYSWEDFLSSQKNLLRHHPWLTFLYKELTATRWKALRKFGHVECELKQELKGEKLDCYLYIKFPSTPTTPEWVKTCSKPLYFKEVRRSKYHLKDPE